MFIYARENKDKKIEENEEKNEKTKERRIDRIEVYVTVEYTVTIPKWGYDLGVDLGNHNLG